MPDEDVTPIVVETWADPEVTTFRLDVASGFDGLSELEAAFELGVESALEEKSGFESASELEGVSELEG